MEIFDFDSIKQIGKQVEFSDSILVCQDPEPKFSRDTPTHAHRFYELLYAFTGDGVGLFSDSTYLMSYGSLTLVRPGEQHAYFSTSNLSIANICVYPTPSQKRILDNIIFTEIILPEEARIEFEYLYSLLTHFLRLKNSTKANFYLEIILDMLSSLSVSEHKNDLRWGQLLHHISQHYSTITLEEAAKICNYSVGHFCRMFKKDFSVTFSQYIDNIRLEKAKHLLANTNIYIDEIAPIVGFSHYTRFYRIFKEETGMTPRQYRVQNGKASTKGGETALEERVFFKG